MIQSIIAIFLVQLFNFSSRPSSSIEKKLKSILRRFKLQLRPEIDSTTRCVVSRHGKRTLVVLKALCLEIPVVRPQWVGSTLFCLFDFGEERETTALFPFLNVISFCVNIAVFFFVFLSIFHDFI